MTTTSLLNGHPAGQTVAALQTLNQQLSAFRDTEVKLEIKTEDFRLAVEYQLHNLSGADPYVRKLEYEVYTS